MDTMSNGVFLIVLAIPAAMSAICVFVALRALRQRAALQAAERLYPAKARVGYAMLQGLASAKQLLAAPLTGKPCVWFDIRVEKWGKPAPDRDAQWMAIRQETSGTAFDIAWEGAQITLDPDGAEVTPSILSDWKGAHEQPLDRDPEAVKPGDGQRSGPRIDFSGGPNSKFHYVEKRIHADDPVFALGEISSSGSGFTLAKPAQSGQPFIISTTEPGAHAARQRTGAIAALVLSGVFDLAVVALLWARFT